jgi:hypothetical protein
VLAVGHDELGVGDDDDEAAEGWGTRVGTWEITWSVLDLSCARLSVAASRLRASERAQYFLRAASTKYIYIFKFYCYICILLIKTNSMIYNMLYKYGVKAYVRARCGRR